MLGITGAAALAVGIVKLILHPGWRKRKASNAQLAEMGCDRVRARVGSETGALRLQTIAAIHHNHSAQQLSVVICAVQRGRARDQVHGIALLRLMRSHVGYALDFP